jgi:GT2 family glycosyltransferase
VAATRERAAYFARSTLLGRSLEFFPPVLRPRIFLRTDNHGTAAEGLAALYNRAIDALPATGQVVFLHDDIHLHDWFLTERLAEAFDHFDLVGLVGCITPADDQPSATHTLDAESRPIRCLERGEAGVLNHFDPHRIAPDVYGPTPQACGLLDGCFLACRLETLSRTGLRFDPRFAFHCYDADFCRTARSLGLRLGTWPIACTHGSPGGFDASWRQAALGFRQKWCPSPSMGR